MALLRRIRWFSISDFLPSTNKYFLSILHHQQHEVYASQQCEINSWLLLNPIVSIQTSNVGWKTKYDTVRWEWNPFIAIILFRKWIFSWTVYWSKDYCKNLRIWETIIDHIYYNKPLKLHSTDQYLDDSNILICKNQ